MNAKNRKIKLQKFKQQQKQLQKKEESFNTQIDLKSKRRQYNALSDPHASYYFVNRSVRNHLKSIKRAALDQTTHSAQKQRLKKLLDQKIKFRPRSFFQLKQDAYQLDQMIANQVFRKTSIKTVQTQRARPLFRFSEKLQDQHYRTVKPNRSLGKKNFQILSEQLKKGILIQNQQDSVEKVKDSDLKTAEHKKKGSSRPNLKHQKAHQKNHKKFLNFIQSKKQLLLKLKKNQNNQQGQTNKNEEII